MRDNAEAPGSLELVLATEGKTPLKDAASSSPQRTKKAADRSKVSRNRIIAGVVVAVVAIVGIFMLTRGGKSTIFHNDTPAPGEVNFQLKDVSFVPYQLQGDQNAEKQTAHAAADDIKTKLNTMFQTAYVDPDTWGDPGEIEDLFTGGAKDQVGSDLTTLTLGDNPGDTYTAVAPGKSTIKVHVLTDAKGNGVRASAALSFTALATHTDGTYSSIAVTGTAIFVQDGGTWKIEAYRLNRSEKPAKAPAASSSPTSEAS
jgi:hypothetical protein